MSGRSDTVDTGQLAEALLLADPEEPESLGELRRLLEALLPWPHTDQASDAEPVVRECLAMLDDADGGGAADVLDRLSAALAPIMEAADAHAAAAQARPADPPAQDDAAATDAPDRSTRPRKPVVDAAPDTGDTRADPTPPAASSAAAPPPASLADDPELVREFVDRSREHLDEADALLLTLEDDQGDKEAVNSVFRVFHTIKGMAGFLAFQAIEEAAHDAEDKLDAVRKGTMALDQGTMDSLFAAVDVLRGLLVEVVEPGGAGETPASDKPSAERRAAPASGPAAGRENAVTAPRRPRAARTAPRLDDVGAPRTAVEPEKAVAPATAPSPPGNGDKPARTGAAARVRGTVHVDEERLDRLLETIGELVIAEASVGQSLQALPGAAESVAAQFSHLDKISRQLQEMATSMRMVTFRTTLRRMARLVRDLSRESGKDVRCVLEGEEIELDKHVVEGINDSLIHLVRNAVDHGIEDDPQERVRAGKPATATVRISATHTGGRIIIEVADDGRGIDKRAVVNKARDLGLIGPDETPSPEAVMQLVFSPGFSTARKVTGVSGRGVGMDVVKRTAEGLLGSCAVTSTLGQGTSARLTLPLTLAIIDGMIVRVGGERYIIPALSIVRSLRMDEKDVTGVLGRAEMLPTPQGLVPLVRLAQLFASNGRGHEDDTEVRDDLVTIVSEADGSSLTGLVVSELVGQQQIVMKSLGVGLGEIQGVSGAAILPDGTVGLVIDVQQTVRLAHGRKG
jgi:two-component system, chemotaxis family, sensor kinase CheA